MGKRFLSIWFPYLKTDWFARKNPGLRNIAFVLRSSDHGKMIVSESNLLAKQHGISKKMAIADARAILPSLKVIEDIPELPAKVLTSLGEWCIRFTPAVSTDLPNGLILDASGCAHLWGGETNYIEHIQNRLQQFGYHVKLAMADTIGAAWGVARFSRDLSIIESGQETAAIANLPASALRIESETVDRLCKMGLRSIQDFITLPRAAMERRFGNNFIKRLDQALGRETEFIELIVRVDPYQERLPTIEPITTANGIQIALEILIKVVCEKLKLAEQGVRSICFSCYRTDGKVEKIEIGTNRPTNNVKHLLKLFEIKQGNLMPGPGIELFTLDVRKVEKVSVSQGRLWKTEKGFSDIKVSELIDRFTVKFGEDHVQRFLPAEHYWPERSFSRANPCDECQNPDWKIDKPRPIQLLSKPEPIEVTAPIPDYPPMLFRHRGKLHKIVKADGPERIEREWWIEEGQHRDYYYVEDEEGCRYWLFRLGHYADKTYQWFIHGYFS